VPGDVEFLCRGETERSAEGLTDKGERLLYAEYATGNKNGLLCLFREQLPWFVQEWQEGVFKEEYLVMYVDKAPKALPSAKFAEADVADCDSAREQLGAVERRLGRDEDELKRNVASWSRKMDRLPKQSKVPPPSPSAKRGTVVPSNEDRERARAQDLERQWRAALSLLK
jgi:hypothetical protein